MAPPVSEFPSSPSCLIDFAQPQQAAGARLRLAFGAPVRILQAQLPQEVAAVLNAAEQAAQAGAWCVGYLRYEAAGAFDPALQTHPPDGPLAWFALYDRAWPWPATHTVRAAPQVAWAAGMARADFDAAMAQLAQGIANGVYYQVNLTAPLHGKLNMPPGMAPDAAARALFAALQRSQPGGYSMYLASGQEHILSVSPELFFDWQGGQLLARPMKGTALRGSTPQADAASAQALRESEKERAENVMIVDLLRNDLSRVAEPHSVQVPRLFHLEALPSVWQMTSDITARSRAGSRLSDIFAALFPCGSVTGAPKVPAMQAIRALEWHPRGIYCGALGLLQPGGSATFNVPIRTVTLHGDAARCGIGSGITAGSLPQQEWEEWQHKQIFVQRASAAFSLLETLRLCDGRLHHGDAHLARLQGAAQHFGFPWPHALLHSRLQQVQREQPAGSWRLRLLLDLQGGVRVEVAPLPPTPPSVRLALAAQPMYCADDDFLRFKTTRRAHYEAFAPSDPAVFDTLLWNHRGELTECTRGNIALQLRGAWLTPALSCGLLGGVERAAALADGRLREAVVRVDELAHVSALAFVNSLRGWVAAELDVPLDGRAVAGQMPAN